MLRLTCILRSTLDVLKAISLFCWPCMLFWQAVGHACCSGRPCNLFCSVLFMHPVLQIRQVMNTSQCTLCILPCYAQLIQASCEGRAPKPSPSSLMGQAWIASHACVLQQSSTQGVPLRALCCTSSPGAWTFSMLFCSVLMLRLTRILRGTPNVLMLISLAG